MALLALVSCAKPVQVDAEEASASAVDSSPPVESAAQEPTAPATQQESPVPKKDQKAADDDRWELPVFPEAVKISDEKRGVVRTIVLETAAKPEQVTDYYRDKVGEVIGEALIGPTATLEGQRLNEHYTIVAMALGGKTKIEIRIEYSP